MRKMFRERTFSYFSILKTFTKLRNVNKITKLRNVNKTENDKETEGIFSIKTGM